MFISKETTSEDFEFVVDGKQFTISKDIALDRNYLDFLCTTYPNSKITIHSGYSVLYSSPTTLYDEDETKTLADNANYVLEKYGKELTFDEDFSVKQAITASRKINNIVKEINETNINGEPLSPFEKFILAYRFVTDRIYKEVDAGEDLSKSRSVISVLNGDKIVCAGYANLLATILNRLGIPCTTQCMIAYDEEHKAYGNHATCLVRMVDPKYKIDGIYFSDPTADRALKHSVGYGSTSFNSALLRVDSVHKFFKKPIRFNMALLGLTPTTIKEVDRSALEIQPMLSTLFPEKFGGKPQNVIIREDINRQLKERNINQIMEDLISNISADSADQISLENANRVLNSARIMHQYTNGLLSNHFMAVGQHLHYMGYSNEEISSLIETNLSAKQIEDMVLEFYTKTHSYKKPFNERQQKQIDSAIKSISTTVSNVKTWLQTKKFKDKKTEEDFYNDIIHDFASFAVTGMFEENSVMNDKFAGSVRYLLKKGISLHEIKLKLKSMLSGLDYSNYYFEFNDELLDFAETNEQELYTMPFGSGLIFNAPYEEDYDRLTSSAKHISQNDFEKACKQYFISQGFSQSEAYQHAKTMLKRTNIFNPDQLS